MGSGAGLFVYGTLTCDRILGALTGRAFAARPALLEGYVRLTLRMPELPPVPTVTPRAGSTVDGLLLGTVDPPALAVLDDFEMIHSGHYLRAAVRVQLAGGGTAPAEAYVAGPSALGYLAEPWDRERFLADYRALYLQHVIPAFLARRSLAS